jgi:hypothetical protein
MGIRNLNALKAWEHPSDYVAPEDPGETPEWRSIALDEPVVLHGDKRFTHDNIYSYIQDVAGDFFFVQVEGFADGSESVQAQIGETGDVFPVGFMGAVTANDGSLISIELIPVGSFLLFPALHVSEIPDMIASYVPAGLVIEQATNFGAVFENGTPAQFHDVG